MSARVRAPLVALAASIGLIAVYLAFGGATYGPTQVADPCEARDLALLEQRDLFDTLALSSLDGAACELGVDREELALALADEETTQQFAEDNQIDAEDIENAVRAGLERAVDDAAASGKVDGFEETVLRQVAANAPVGATISALQALSDDDSVQSLLEELGGLQDLGLDDLADPGNIPGYDELNDLLP